MCKVKLRGAPVSFQNPNQSYSWSPLKGPQVINLGYSIGADKFAKVVAVVISTCAQGTLGAMSSGVLPEITGEELASYAYAK